MVLTCLQALAATWILISYLFTSKARTMILTCLQALAETWIIKSYLYTSKTRTMILASLEALAATWMFYSSSKSGSNYFSIVVVCRNHCSI